MRLRILLVILALLGVVFSIQHNNARSITDRDKILKTPTRLQKIYKKMSSSIDLAAPKLFVIKSDEINAYNKGYSIVFTDAILREFTDDNELAGIVAHELAHSYLEKAHKIVMSRANIFNENAADKMSIYILLRSGYNPCLTNKFARHFKKMLGDCTKNCDHPSWTHRIESLDLPQCRH